MNDWSRIIEASGMDPDAMYANEVSGDIQSGEDWAIDSLSWEGCGSDADRIQELQKLILVDDDPITDAVNRVLERRATA